MCIVHMPLMSLVIIASLTLIAAVLSLVTMAILTGSGWLTTEYQLLGGGR